MPKFLDHHPTMPVPPEAMAGMRQQMGNRQPDGFTPLQFVVGKEQSYCLSEADSIDVVHKHHEAMGVMLGALMIHGIAPGPRLYLERPDLFWGVIASMVIGNLMLIVLNVPLIGIFVRLLRIPPGILSPLILLICIVGAFSINNSATDVFAMFVAGLAGYLMKKSLIDSAPLIIAFVLGTMFESSLHQSLAIGYGSAWIFLERPISATLLGAALVVVVLSLMAPMLTRRLADADDRPQEPAPPVD